MYKKWCWYLVAPEPFGDGVCDLEECSGRVSEESAARTYCLSGRTWTLLALPVPVGPGRCWLFLFVARERSVKGKRDGWGSLTAGRNGPGRKEKAGRPGFLRNGRERARKKKEKAGKPGFPRSGRERARKKRRKRESRGSLAMGGNGPGRKEKAGCRLGRKRSRSRSWS
jgi:hypothetical protein